MKDSPYKVPNLDRALTVLELLQHHPAGLTVSEIAGKLAAPVNSIFRISMTLLDRGYFIRDEKTKRFRLSRKLLPIAASAISDKNLIELAIGPMRELRNEVKETVLLGTLLPDEGKGVTIEQIPGLHPFKYLLDVGSELLLHVGAPGKCLLACAPEREREDILRKIKLTSHTRNTITTKRALLKELALVRKNGYAVDRGEWMDEMHCVGAPILDRHEYPVAALWITGPSTRIPATDFETLGEIMKKTASTITEALRDEHL